MKLRAHVHLPLLLVIILTSSTAFLTSSYQLVNPDISDSIGYVQASHQLARGEGLAFADPHNRIGQRYYTLYAFKVVYPESPYPYFSFPPALPLLGAAMERLVGDPAAVHALPPLTAALLVAVTCLLGMLLVNKWAGLWAGLALLATPVFLQFSTAFWSEVPSASFLYLGFVLCTVSLRRPRDDPWAIGLAGVGGLAIGTTFFMRFSNASAVPALLALVWVAGGRAAFRQWRVIWLISVVAAALVALLIFNAMYYGGPFVTGYSPIHGWYDQPAFSLAYAFDESFVNGRSVPAIGAELVRDFGWLLLFALLGVIARPRLVNGWLVSLAMCLLAPYTIYAFAAEGINARFVIPAWVAVCLLVGRGITAVGTRLPGKAWRWLLGLVLAAGIVHNLPSELALLQARNEATQAQIDQVQQMVASTEPNAVILSYVFNDLIAVYGHRSVLNYRHISPYDPVSGAYQHSEFEGLLVEEINQLLDQGTPVYYILDRDVPLYDSYEILMQHFKLTPILNGGPIYQVRNP